MRTEEDTADRCFYCMEKVGKGSLKKCSGCHLVRYCSKSCQKAAWPTHKPRCARGAELLEQAEANPNVEELTVSLSKWLTCWRHTLFNYAMLALDLSNHPRNRLETHCVFIELQRRDSPPSRAQSFLMRGGGVYSREEFIQIMRDHLDATEDNIQDWANDRRGDHTVQVVLSAESHMRCLWVSFRDLSQYQNAPKETARLMAAHWQDTLIQAIDDGKP